MRALGIVFVGQDGNKVVLKAPYRADLVGDPDSGVLAGGVVTALLDHTCGMAVWAKMEAYTPIATLDLRIDYMRASTPGQDLFAEAECFRIGRSVAFVRAWAYDQDASDPVAAAQGSFMLNSDGDRRQGATLKPGASA
jgi:uncharacterized protein (TIGR00369 family)